MVAKINSPVEMVLDHGDCGVLDVLLVVGQSLVHVLEIKSCK